VREWLILRHDPHPLSLEGKKFMRSQIERGLQRDIFRPGSLFVTLRNPKRYFLLTATGLLQVEKNYGRQPATYTA